MPHGVRLWEVSSDGTVIKEVEGSNIGLEKRLQGWLESDISFLDPDLLVIGREVRTDYGEKIDLLCIDSAGALVIVELKQGKTPRDVAAQVLDYASWAQDLTTKRVEEIANDYLADFDNATEEDGDSEEKDTPLGSAFQRKFDHTLPEVLNGTHRSLIVAESTDSATERIVRYLSDLGVPINVATVEHFTDRSGRELLASVNLLDEEAAEAARRRQGTSKRRTPSVTDLERIATETGCDHLLAAVRAGVQGKFYRDTMGHRFAFRRQVGDAYRTFLSVDPKAQDGAMPFIVYSATCAEALGMAPERLRAALPTGSRETQTNIGHGFAGTLSTPEEVSALTRALVGAAEETDGPTGPETTQAP